MPASCVCGRILVDSYARLASSCHFSSILNIFDLHLIMSEGEFGACSFASSVNFLYSCVFSEGVGVH